MVQQCVLAVKKFVKLRARIPFVKPKSKPV